MFYHAFLQFHKNGLISQCIKQFLCCVLSTSVFSKRGKTPPKYIFIWIFIYLFIFSIQWKQSNWPEVLTEKNLSIIKTAETKDKKLWFCFLTKHSQHQSALVKIIISKIWFIIYAPFRVTVHLLSRNLCSNCLLPQEKLLFSFTFLNTQIRSISVETDP